MGSQLRGGLVVVLMLALAGCSAGAPGKAVTITVSEFKIQADTSRVAAGDVTFTIKNQGVALHEFVVARTDLAEGALPKEPDGNVAEGGPLTVVDEVEDIAPGTTATLTVKLEPGKYVVFCNLAGHYAGGMHSSVEVVAN